MNLVNPAPPTLCSISQCKIELDFEPLTHWPEGLPAVAVNDWVLAGFQQKLVFNHNYSDAEMSQLPSLFRSLYAELSFIELARLWQKTQNLEWFPFREVADSYHIRVNEQFELMSKTVLTLPKGFQTWSAAKKVGLSDLLPILSAHSLEMNPIFHKILTLKMSKADGIQALELAIDLSLMGRTPDELGLIADSIKFNELNSSVLWLEHLKNLRFPQSRAKDKSAEMNLSQLPWPGSSQVKWARHGDKAGIEVKLFVSQPEDLKRYAKSFEKIQDLLESTQGDLWKEH